jgi:hypothetical protein
MRQRLGHGDPALCPACACWSTFTSGSVLGSIRSAAGCSALFADFFATMTESNIPYSCIRLAALRLHGADTRTSCWPNMRSRGFRAKSFFICHSLHSRYRAPSDSLVAFVTASGPRDLEFLCGAHWLACELPYRCFLFTRRMPAHNSGSMRLVRYSFMVSDSHRHSLPVSRRTPCGTCMRNAEGRSWNMSVRALVQIASSLSRCTQVPENGQSARSTELKSQKSTLSMYGDSVSDCAGIPAV